MFQQLAWKKDKEKAFDLPSLFDISRLGFENTVIPGCGRNPRSEEHECHQLSTNKVLRCSVSLVLDKRDNDLLTKGTK